MSIINVGGSSNKAKKWLGESVDSHHEVKHGSKVQQVSNAHIPTEVKQSHIGLDSGHKQVATKSSLNIKSK